MDDEIKDEKLQYDISREAAKTSALSSWKADKYEFLTDEEVPSPDQRSAIEQAKFTYYPLGKAFEKLTKTIEDQGEKQIKALEKHGKQLVKYNKEKESSMHSKQKKILELANKRMQDIQDLSKQIDWNNSTYRYEVNTTPKAFIVYKGPLGFLEI